MYKTDGDYKPRIGEYLVSLGAISQEQLDKALLVQQASDERLGVILRRLGYCSQSVVYQALSILNPDSLHDELLIQNIIPDDELLRHRTVLKAITDNEVHYSSLSGDDPEVILKKYFADNTKFVRVDCEVRDITRELRLLEQQYRRRGRDLLQEKRPFNVLEKLAEKAVIDNVSDIHIQTNTETVEVKFRYDGVLETYIELSARDNFSRALLTTIKDVSGGDIAKKHGSQDGRFTMKVQGRPVDFRVSIASSSERQENCVIRIHDQDRRLVDADKLGFEPIIYKSLKELATSSNGFIIVAGATSQGKSTTLMSSAKSLIDCERRKVYTIEDPVEFRLPLITQFELQKGQTFAEYIRRLMRQDPDVIIVGEIRDEETAQAAFAAATTGHLVYSTVHANDVSTVPSRLLTLGVQKESYQDILQAVLVQRLVRKLCLKCGGTGCHHCRFTGYFGRTLACEYADLREDGAFQLLYGNSRSRLSYYTFKDSVHFLLSKNITDIREIKRVFSHSECEQIFNVKRRLVMPMEDTKELINTANNNATSDTGGVPEGGVALSLEHLLEREGRDPEEVLPQVHETVFETSPGAMSAGAQAVVNINSPSVENNTKDVLPSLQELQAELETLRQEKTALETRRGVILTEFKKLKEEDVEAQKRLANLAMRVEEIEKTISEIAPAGPDATAMMSMFQGMMGQMMEMMKQMHTMLPKG